MLNLEKSIFQSDNSFNIPQMKRINYIDDANDIEWIPFNYALSTKDRDKKGVHFFTHDYQFERVWNSPDRYINLLRSYKYVLSPDFSLYTDLPLALQIYNEYRDMWLGRYWQGRGINVIPSVSWSDEQSFEWSFDGIAKHSVIAISSVGCLKNKEYRAKFLKGVDKAIETIQPIQILWHGIIPKEISIKNIVHINYFTEKYEGKI